MPPIARNLVGTITATAWLGVGVFMIFRGASETWRMAGFLVVAVGIFRAVLLVRQWKKDKS